jgi:hypothetical protein
MQEITLPRRRLLRGLLGATLAPLATRAAGTVPVTVWKDPTCGCCRDWIAHLEASGFRATVHDTGNAGQRAELGLPLRYGACHTALVGGYVVEGHVPAADIARLLVERPDALGLAVPGMPVGSPGMDTPAYRGRRDAYAVLLVDRLGGHRVFARYDAVPAAP